MLVDQNSRHGFFFLYADPSLLMLPKRTDLWVDCVAASPATGRILLNIIVDVVWG